MTIRTRLPEQRAQLGALRIPAAQPPPLHSSGQQHRGTTPAGRTAPTEAARHSVGHYGGLHPEDVPHLSEDMPPPQPARQRRAPVAARASSADEEDDDARYQTRLPTSTRRYNVDLAPRWDEEPPTTVVVHRRQRSGGRSTDAAAAPRRQCRRMHWLWYVGVGMLVILAILLVGWLVSLFLHWCQVSLDDWHYGRPRTFQIDAVVGHQDSAAHPSHFIALNLHGQVEIIELPGGDSTHARIYQGPPLLGDGADLVPVTLSFQDVNGDGKPDLLMHIGERVFVLLNDTVGGTPTFRPLKPGEQVTVPSA